jgi:hypothetical protein
MIREQNHLNNKQHYVALQMKNSIAALHFFPLANNTVAWSIYKQFEVVPIKEYQYGQIVLHHGRPSVTDNSYLYTHFSTEFSNSRGTHCVIQ